MFGFIGGRWVQWRERCGSLGSNARALGAVGFIRGSYVNLCARWGWLGSFVSLVHALGVDEFIRDHWICSRAHWGSLGLSLEDVGFARASAGVRWVHPGTLGSLGRTLGVVGIIFGFARAHHGDLWVYPRSVERALGVVVLFRGR